MLGGRRPLTGLGNFSTMFFVGRKFVIDNETESDLDRATDFGSIQIHACKWKMVHSNFVLSLPSNVWDFSLPPMRGGGLSLGETGNTTVTRY